MKHIYTLIALLCCTQILAQDPHFSQFYANQLYLNPALTGVDRAQKISISYRNQWPALHQAYNTYFLSYQTPLKKSIFSVGSYVLKDDAANGSHVTHQAAGLISGNFRIKRRIGLKLGAKLAFVQQHVDMNNLIFSDMLDENQGVVQGTLEPQPEKIETFDIAVGGVFYWDNFFLGFATDHAATSLPEIEQDEIMPQRYTAHIGNKFKFETPVYEYKINVSPQVMYMQQGQLKQLSAGLYLSNQKFVLGAWHRIKDSFILLAGMHTKQYKFGYSFDFGTSHLGVSSGGAHELSMSYTFKTFNSHKRRRYTMLECPVF